MAKQTINQGTAPTGAGGDTFRTGSAKLQANDDELYAHLGAGDGSLTAAKTRTALGLGTAATQRFSAPMGLTAPINLDAYSEPCIGMFKNISAASPPESNTIWGFLIQATSGGSAGPDRSLQIFGNDTSVNLYYRKNTPSIGVWRKFLSSGNTTTDANGFIKAASPIVQLFADRIELNDEAKQQEITFDKVGTGNYLIKDSSGFAQEGWYIETPKDANGNVLFSVIYTTLENGDISVKTYKKKFDLETASIVADLDNPVDITENRWIDLRLQELPQPEIEIPESTTPPDFQPTGLAEAVATIMESYNDTEQ